MGMIKPSLLATVVQVTLNKTYVMQSGIDINVNGAVPLNNAQVMLNGFSYSANGVKIGTNQQAIFINTSAFIGNHIHGLHLNTIDYGISITIKTTTYFGNGVSSPLTEVLYVVISTVKIYYSV